MPSRVRPAFATLWNLDLAFADVVATSSDPALGAIRLAWWRERLEELDVQEAPAAEPRLRAIQRQLLGRGITGRELSKLEDAWLPLLEPFPWGDRVAEGLRLRGQILFGIGARLLACKASDAEEAGALWSLADGAAHCSDPASRDYLQGHARQALDELPSSLPPEVRPLTVLAALVAHDLSGGSRIGRVGAALRHRMRGSVPRR